MYCNSFLHSHMLLHVQWILYVSYEISMHTNNSSTYGPHWEARRTFRLIVLLITVQMCQCPKSPTRHAVMQLGLCALYTLINLVEIWSTSRLHHWIILPVYTEYCMPSPCKKLYHDLQQAKSMAIQGKTSVYFLPTYKHWYHTGNYANV